MSKNTTLTPSRFRAILTADRITDAMARDGIAHLRAIGARARMERAQWADRRQRDGVSTADVAEEIGVTSDGRVTQIVKPYASIIASGVPVPTTDAEAETMGALYAHVYPIYKNGGAKIVSDATETIGALSDVAAKMSAWQALEGKPRATRKPQTGDKPSKDTQTTEDGPSMSAPTDSLPTEAPTTFAGRLHALVLEAASAPIGDLDEVVTLASELLDALSERAAVAIDA